MRFTFATALLALGASAAAHYVPSHSNAARGIVERSPLELDLMARGFIPRHGNKKREKPLRRCGGNGAQMSETHLNQSMALHKAETAKVANNAKAFDFDINVNVHVHVVSASKETFIKKKQIKDQMDKLNEAFNPNDVYFKLESTDFLAHANWSVGGDDSAMKKRLRKGLYKDLNIYFLDKVILDGEEVLGHCTLPEPDVVKGDSLHLDDGCVIDVETLPGGSMEPYNLGATAVHEVGHWFDLEHPFEGGCETGDGVWDTPATKEANYDCNIRIDTCPDRPGIDAIHNYMDYSDDSCLENFSLGQRRRMHSSWLEYRDN